MVSHTAALFLATVITILDKDNIDHCGVSGIYVMLPVIPGGIQ